MQEGTDHYLGTAKSVCAQQLGGKWLEHEDELSAEFLGKCLVKCSLPEFARDCLTRPHRVLVRFVRPAAELLEPPLDDKAQAAVAKELSSDSCHPQILGTFLGGRIEQFVPSRAFLGADADNVSLVCAAARKLAHIHSAQVEGIDKSPVTYVQALKVLCKRAQDTVRAFDFSAYNKREKREVQQIFSVDLNKEIDWFLKSLHRFSVSSSRVVLCHGNYSTKNFLLPDEYDHRIINKITVVDLQHACYSYRGLDLGCYFLERNFDYSDISSGGPRLLEALDHWDKQFFVREYLKEWKVLNLDIFKASIDNEEVLIREADFFSAARLLLNFAELYMDFFDHGKRLSSHEWDLAFIRKQMYIDLKKELVDMEGESEASNSMVTADSSRCVIS